MHKNYNQNNILYKIINKEISAKIYKENDYSICIFDINPQNNIHLLLLPKGEYIDYEDFLNNAKINETIGFFSLLQEILQNITNYQLITNSGTFQHISHFHMHIISSDILK